MYSVENFKNKTWYHQRFDGCPLFLFLIGEAETMEDSTRPIDTEAKHRICFFEDGKADWFLDYEDIKNGSRSIMNALEENPEWSVEIMKKYQDKELSFYEFCKNFNDTELSLMSDSELLENFKEFHNRALRRFSSSATIDHFALGTDEIVANLIKTELGPFNSEREFTKVFSILTAPVHQSFINEAEIDLLNIAEIARINGLDHIQVSEALTKHTDKYFWIKNNYINGEKTTQKVFASELEIILNSDINIAEAKKVIADTPIKNKELKKELVSKLSLSKKLLDLITTSENFTYWQDERKKASYWCSYAGICLIKEMGRRKFVPVNSLKYLVAKEIEDWFENDKEIIPSFEERKKFCAVIYTKDGFKILEGNEAKTLHKIVDPKDLSETPNDIRGLVANPGLVRGPARIILSATDINLVQPGDILIAVMTRPDYVPGMKKAAAVVTDEGGITSHAAIVTRELGVPCIIGTKIATRVFKNGDMIEVNANHGVVRKLS